MIDHAIHNILNENGFKVYGVIEVKDFNICGVFNYRCSNEKVEYYFITTINEKQLLEIDEKRLFSSINQAIRDSKFYDSEVDKNTSLIICVPLDKKNKINSNLINKELIIEENPYFFKKYVLSYSMDVANDLFKDILQKYNQDSNITKYIENILNDSERFTRFKLNMENNEQYSLVSKIYMKLPILQLKVPDNLSLISLSSIVRNKIIEEKLEKAKKIVAFLSITDLEKDLNENLDLVCETWGKES